MANLMHRFLRNQSCLRAIPRLTPSLIPHQKPCIVESDPVSLANPVITISAFKPDESLRFYPSFPIGYGFNPTMVHGSGLIDMVDAVVEEKDEKEEEVVIHADSVKKKRKKKMNKHKYRKLRKTQGRKS
ncbi:hypothetical protein Bca4012_036961 [Brassica carinata]|uniref:Small ribosomal subunit protein mS38 n=1 Tax=Brassica carinata TaxID=52824 RepID=A0A8X7WGG6_BRACI|nr:hypothetical protein Bca52824_010656 [Brassica carinata]